MSESRWYVDAWAVVDGKLFASRRAPDTATDYLSTAEATVFISVPDLQAVPVGRITTALRATRSSFQDRLRGANGAEIPFDTLDQLRDLVRRGYLGGDLGPGSASALGGPGPAPTVDGGTGVAYLQEVLDFDGEPWSMGDGVIPTSAPPGLDRAVKNFAMAALLQWEDLLADGKPAAERLFWSFAHALTWSAVLNDDPYDAWSELERTAVSFSAPQVQQAVHVLWNSHRLWRYGVDPAFSRVPRGLFNVAPLPRLPHWDARLRRLTEMHVLPLVDSRFWNQPRSTADIAPFVLIHRLRGQPVVGQLKGEATPSARVFEASRASLGRVRLPDEAEVALGHYVDWCLNGRPQDDTAGSPATPGLSATRQIFIDDGGEKPEAGYA